MLRYFYRTVSAHWRTNPVLYGLTVLGVALGVASVISIRILNQSAIASFAAGVRTIGGAADVVVTGKGGTLPDEFFPRVRGTPGVAAAWPVFETTVAVEGKPETFVRLLGVDLLAPAQDFWEALSGLPPKAETGVAVRQRGWVAVTPELAEAMGWKVGDRFGVRGGAGARTLRVGAFIDFQRWGTSGGRRALVTDIAEAQSLFGGAGTLHRIGVKAAEDVDPAALAARIEDGLGGRVDAVTPSERTGQAQQLLGAFRLNLTALSMVSLLVGTFLVFSSMRACLVWQRREFGVLRSLGSTPAQVLALILGEAALLGVMGVVIGIFAGYWTAIWNLDAVSSTLTNVYMLQEIESLEVSGGTLALAVFAGLGGALSGTLLPALDVWRRDTRTLLDTFPTQSTGIAAARNLFRLGLVLVAGALAWYWLLGWRWRPSGFILATAMMLCLPLLAPWLVQRLTGWVRVPDFGFRYGVRSLGATLANTSFSVSSLAMAVCLLVGITLLVESFRETLVRWVDRSLRADVYVTATVAARPGPGATLSAPLVERLAREPEVKGVDPLRRLFLPVGGRRVAVVGVDLSRPAEQRRLGLLSGGDAVGRAVRDRGVLIGEPLSRSASLKVGDRVEIEGPEGPGAAAGVRHLPRLHGRRLGHHGPRPHGRKTRGRGPHQHRASPEARRRCGSRGGRHREPAPSRFPQGPQQPTPQGRRAPRLRPDLRGHADSPGHEPDHRRLRHHPDAAGGGPGEGQRDRPLPHPGRLPPAGVPAVREQGNRHGVPRPGHGLRRRHRPRRDPDLRHSKELLRLEHRVDLALAAPGRRSPRHRLRRRAGEPLPGVQGQPHAGE